jgi:DNA-binding winged helix-turn-helix (wHTH) protein
VDADSEVLHARPANAKGRLLILGSRLAFDGARRQVSDELGVVLHLTPKAFDLLSLLVEQSPRVVPKAELHERLWPGTFVTDAALSSLVKELRRVLGDRDPVAPLIRTAHGIGYALAGSVEVRQAPLDGQHWLVGEDRRHFLHLGTNVIGRDPGADIWLNDATVSRRHARILVESSSVLIEDLQSKNGTSVGEARVERPTPLHDGDIVGVGSLRLIYRCEGDDTSTAAVLPSRSAATDASTDVRASVAGQDRDRSG